MYYEEISHINTKININSHVINLTAKTLSLRS